MNFTRRKVLQAGVATGISMAAGPGTVQAQPQMILKTIPSSGEMVPPIGVGTNRYDVGESAEERAPLQEALETFHRLGGKIIDTAPVYGRSEQVIGDLLAELGSRDELFLASKSDIRGQVQGVDSYQQTFDRLSTDMMNLMQVHSLRNTASELAVMREWKAQGRIKYIGVTTSETPDHAALEQTMRDESETLDFIQVNYSMEDRSSADRILPLAEDLGLGVLINVPFSRGESFDRADGADIPDWAAEIDVDSWGQFFLKYIISHSAVTAAIPGTRRARYAIDNMGAAMGRLPDATMRREMEILYDSL